MELSWPEKRRVLVFAEVIAGLCVCGTDERKERKEKKEKRRKKGKTKRQEKKVPKR